MAPEIISLLSSPEPDPLPSKPSGRTSKTLGYLGRSITKQTNHLLYETVDRIPESSNPGPSAQQDDWRYSSDDFDLTGDLKGGRDDDEKLSVDDRPSKRRRVSKSPSGSSVAGKATSKLARPAASKSVTASGPIAPQSPPRAYKQAAPADLIELSSSPVVPVRRATTTAKADTLDGGMSDSSTFSNPFRSSPPRRKTTETSVAKPVKADTFDGGISDSSAFSNPFRSSPPPRKTTETSVAKPSKGKEKEVLSGAHPWFSPKKSAVWDPISSSAPATNGARSSPPARALQRSRSDAIVLDDSELDLRSDGSSDEEFPDDLTKIKAMKLKRRAEPTLKKSRSEGSAPKPRASAAPKKSAEERAREKEQKKLERELAKEEAKKEKEKAKEQRAHEKKQAAALAEVNKIRTDKKVSTPEMLVDLPLSLPDTTKLQAETLLRDLQVDFQPWSSPVENVVKWRRKVRARYNEDLGHWEPVPMLIQPEKHAMTILPAAQFVDLVLAGQPGNSNNNSDGDGTAAAATETLDSHITRLKRHFPAHTLIYLIEGLNPWLRRNRTVRDRHFQAAVRSVLPQPEGTDSAVVATAARRRKAPAKQAVYVDEDLVEDALLALQVRHRVLIHHTALPLETARQIAVFTQHLSTLPYRKVKDEINETSAGFCMESGQVRVGDGPRDTYVRMLQEITRVTAPIAYGILGEFPSVVKLVNGLEAEGPLRLEDVRKCADKEGTVGERRVGQAVSKRVWKVFTGKDESSMDV
ncbi:hypothetical protein CONLIGDRAFT_633501 [Coniochaeta ligniaria NRRL 30616]|uniref:ERCC4 domain-containing protein n=1 Tax=Coniochaeta ligniaria NRRL 30616 TaxID=1408157 RepID=A0A1J7J1G8_9PEZI|nr:hypothetical protein CONLIGDRAFT_633501 [Coniochaeta ligniaria NRRL 30616]